jgi:hypothetical protein
VTRRSARLSAAALAVALTLPQGCTTWGRASYKTYDTCGAWFADNPAAWIPYWVGFGLLGIAVSPLDLISWPLTAIFFPSDKEEPSREFYLFSAVGPTVFAGAAGGTLLGAIFYPFGMPFMKSEKDWNDAKPPPEDEQLPPPPGGDAPPVKTPDKAAAPGANH